ITLTIFLLLYTIIVLD
ncbi:Crescent membrane and immature virion formation protein, partial [Monkeypox virus]